MSSKLQQESRSPGITYFDVNGDKELLQSSSDDNDSRLTWRGDPLETGSDCTIVVVTNELQAATYFVHKSIVCFGTRQSKYFAKNLIQNVEGNKMPKGVPSVKVELDQRDAENFPIFLDFMYSNSNPSKQHQGNLSLQHKAALSNGTMETAMSSFSTPSMLTSNASGDLSCNFSDGEEIVTENAVSLRHLARAFENDALIRAANKFIQKDLNFSTGPAYLCTAWEYKDDRLMESSQRLCAENIEQIDTKALIRLPLHLFRIVIKSLESFEGDNKELSIRLSEIVCRYFEKHPETRTAGLLLELTDPLLMPYIASEAAIGYTAIVKDLEPADAAQHWASLVRLCRRCAKAVVKEYGWSDFSVNAAVNEYLDSRRQTGSEGKTTKSKIAPSNLDSLLFSTSFAAALEQAQEDYDDVTATQQALETMVSTLSQSVTALEVAHEQKDVFIQKQKSALEDAQKLIATLQRQLDNTTQRPSAPSQQQQRRFAPPMVHPRLQPPCNAETISVNRSNAMVHAQTVIDNNKHSRLQYTSPLRSEQHTSTHNQPRSVDNDNRRLYLSPQQNPQRPFNPSSAPMARQRMQQQQQHHPSHIPQTVDVQQQIEDDLFGDLPTSHERVHHIHREPPPDLLEMKFPSYVKDLISPTQVGVDIHAKKNRTRQELKTKSEMRSKSLLV